MSESIIKTGGEYKTAEDAIDQLSKYQAYNSIKLKRIRRFTYLPEKPNILELGCSSGVNLVAWQRIGCECIGLEPSEIAIKNSYIISQKLGVTMQIRMGIAEEIPFDNELFDLVNADSVIEHVQDTERATSEIYRVLRPNGVLWFNAASCMCPKQDEIRGFPMFGWYPNSIKLRILQWAKIHRPQLIGFTSYPAINWFTPWKANRMLKKHGFRKIWDRWDLRGDDEAGKVYGFALRLIRSSRVTKFIADVLIPGCSFAAVK